MIANDYERLRTLNIHDGWDGSNEGSRKRKSGSYEQAVLYKNIYLRNAHFT